MCETERDLKYELGVTEEELPLMWKAVERSRGRREHEILGTEERL